MRRILIDTNIYVAFKKNDKQVLKVLKNVDFIGIGVTALAELYAGFAGGSKKSTSCEELDAFLRSPRVSICNHDETTAEFYATIFHSLKKNGTPIPTNDIWIAATAMKMGLALFTLDAHFSQIDGLILK